MTLPVSPALGTQFPAPSCMMLPVSPVLGTKFPAPCMACMAQPPAGTFPAVSTTPGVTAGLCMENAGCCAGPCAHAPAALGAHHMRGCCWCRPMSLLLVLSLLRRPVLTLHAEGVRGTTDTCRPLLLGTLLSSSPACCAGAGPQDPCACRKLLLPLCWGAGLTDCCPAPLLLRCATGTWSDAGANGETCACACICCAPGSGCSCCNICNCSRSPDWWNDAGCICAPATGWCSVTENLR